MDIVLCECVKFESIFMYLFAENLPLKTEDKFLTIKVTWQPILHFYRKQNQKVYSSMENITKVKSIAMFIFSIQLNVCYATKPKR